MSLKTVLLATSLISVLSATVHAANEIEQIKQLGVTYTDDNTFHFTNTPPVDRILTKTLDIDHIRDKMRLDPILFLNMRREKQIINLTAAQSSSVDGDQILELDKAGNGYLVSRKIDGILSPMPIFKYAWAGIELLTDIEPLPFIGLAPIKGYGRKEVRYVKRLKEAQDLRRLFVPTQKVEADRMKVGESVTFRTHGGRLFGAGISAFGLGVRGAIVVRGTWETTVKKVSANEVLVSQLNVNIDKDGHKIIDDYKEKIRSIHLGNFLDLRKIETSQIRTSHSYIVNLDNDEARQAYIQFIKGNSIPIEQLAKNTNFDAVTQYMSFTEDMEAELLRKRASIPLLFKYEKIKALFSVDGILNDNPIEETNFYEYDAYVEHTYRRTAVNKQKYKILAFVGNISEEKDESEPELTGTFLYDYSDNKAKTRVVNRRIRDFVKFTGLKEADYKFPIKGKVGYFNMSMTVNIPTETTHYLMDLADQDRTNQVMGNLSDRVVSGYVHHMGEKEKECQDFDRNSDRELRKLGIMELDIHKRCFKRLKRKARSNMTSILNSLRKMKDALNQDNKNEFAKNYGEFGKAILRNRFNFQTILNLIKDKGAQLRIIFQGERISQVKKEIKWVSN